MNRKKTRWFLCFIFIAALLVFIALYPIPSLLAWQSGFASKCFFILMLCFGLCLLRITLGPKLGDKIAAINTLGILIVGFCAILSIPTGRDWYLDIAIAWALQGFIGTLVFSKYLEGKGFDD